MQFMAQDYELNICWDGAAAGNFKIYIPDMGCMMFLSILNACNY